MYSHINTSQIFVLDQDKRSDVGNLGSQVDTDTDLGFMPAICVPGDRSRQILLERPVLWPRTKVTAGQVRDLLTKGAGGGLVRSRPPRHARHL